MKLIHELLPCPFCGSDEVTIGSFGSSYLEPQHYVQCEECDGATVRHASEGEAVAAWNRRAAPVAADAAAPINLEGLRKKLLTPRKILRDEQGFLTHPDFPICDEGTHADALLEAFGIESRFRSMENDLPDLHERWCDEGLDDCSEWTPTPPEGDGWLLLSIYDTEDGPYALFGRGKYEAENALKRMRTRELSERIQQRQALEGGQQ
jgi:Lar family restriction alleviation protein